MDAKAAEQSVIRFKLDGREVEALPGETILNVARRTGTEILFVPLSVDIRGRAKAVIDGLDAVACLLLAAGLFPGGVMSFANWAHLSFAAGVLFIALTAIYSGFYRRGPQRSYR